VIAWGGVQHPACTDDRPNSLTLLIRNIVPSDPVGLSLYTSAMTESKPAIGVTHAIINGEPRVMIALYPNHPSSR
jgi:hypothetical protein